VGRRAPRAGPDERLAAALTSCATVTSPRRQPSSADEREWTREHAAVLSALLDDRLYVRTQDQKVFIVKSAEDTGDARTRGSALAGGRRRAASTELTKIGTNNRLRRELKTASPDSTCRTPMPTCD
jgi:hypothetical protein